jgi:hypothetical protein
MADYWTLDDAKAGLEYFHHKDGDERLRANCTCLMLNVEGPPDAAEFVRFADEYLRGVGVDRPRFWAEVKAEVEVTAWIMRRPGAREVAAAAFHTIEELHPPDPLHDSAAAQRVARILPKEMARRVFFAKLGALASAASGSPS